MEDSRVTAARAFIKNDRTDDGDCYPQAYDIITDLLTYAEGRLQINVGLIAENAGLRQKIGAPPTLDLSTTPTADLLAELARRLEDR